MRGAMTAKLVVSIEWCARLAHMADIFQHLNELNTRMQGRNENLLTNTDKINGFRSKVQLWQQHSGKYQPWHVPTHTEMTRCQHLHCVRQ